MDCSVWSNTLSYVLFLKISSYIHNQLRYNEMKTRRNHERSRGSIDTLLYIHYNPIVQVIDYTECRVTLMAMHNSYLRTYPISTS